jgi:hypothetical protein
MRIVRAIIIPAFAVLAVGGSVAATSAVASTAGHVTHVQAANPDLLYHG